MTVFYDPLVYFPRVRWSKTIYPRVLSRLEFWLCLCSHLALVVLLWRGHLHLPDERSFLVPLEIAVPLFCLTGLSAVQLSSDCRKWHEAITRSSVRVGEETRRFVQELQASFGRIDDVLPLRFVAAKYSLAAVYVFFFTLSGGAVTPCGWSEIRAKGLLQDREVQFMEKQYSGDRIAMLHIWAMWAVQEATASATVRTSLGSEAIAQSLGRLADALRGASDAAREAAGRAAVPVPYHQFHLHDTLTLVSMLVLAAIVAPPSAASCAAAFSAVPGAEVSNPGTGSLTDYLGFFASLVYLVVLAAALGWREASAALSDPLRGVEGFPVAATVNTTADAVAQLLIASTPAAFNPESSWWDAAHCLLTQNQIERRTPQATFGTVGANPTYFRERKPPVPGDQAPPPLLDSGVCHLDLDALPSMKVVKGAKHQMARKPQRQEGAAALLARVHLAVETSHKGFKGTSSTEETEDPSEGSCYSAPLRTNNGSESMTTSEASAGRWDATQDSLSALPREHSLVSSVTNFCYPGSIGASKAGVARRVEGMGTPPAREARSPGADPAADVIVKGTWAEPPKQPAGDSCPRTPPIRTPPWPHRGSSVSPEDLVLSTSGTAAGSTRRL